MTVFRQCYGNRFRIRATKEKITLNRLKTPCRIKNQLRQGLKFGSNLNNNLSGHTFGTKMFLVEPETVDHPAAS